MVATVAKEVLHSACMIQYSIGQDGFEKNFKEFLNNSEELLLLQYDVVVTLCNIFLQGSKGVIFKEIP